MKEIGGKKKKETVIDIFICFYFLLNMVWLGVPLNFTILNVSWLA